MDAPITILANEGNYVKFGIWTNGTILLNEIKGVVGPDGSLSKTFFSLQDSNVQYKIGVWDDKVKVIDEKIDGSPIGLDYPITFDCTSSKCAVSVDDSWVSEKTNFGEGANVVHEEGAAPAEDNLTTEETPVAEEETLIEEIAPAEEEKSSSLTGHAIFTNADGSIAWYTWAVGAIVVLFLVFIFMKMFNQGATVDVATPASNRELKKIQKQIKRKEDEIKRVKEGKRQSEEVKKAKQKLDEEERELKDLEKDSPESKAVEEAQKKLDEEEEELKELKDED